MKILSVRQPWASLIVSGAKDVENRTWSTRYRGPILIHAAQRADDVTSDEIERRYGIRPPFDMPLGGVLGLAEIVGCVRGHCSVWYAPAHWAFVLRNARALPFVRWKGSLSLAKRRPSCSSCSVSTRAARTSADSATQPDHFFAFRRRIETPSLTAAFKINAGER
jgi:ASCH domain-containing protein